MEYVGNKLHCGCAFRVVWGERESKFEDRVGIITYSSSIMDSMAEKLKKQLTLVYKENSLPNE